MCQNDNNFCHTRFHKIKAFIFVKTRLTKDCLGCLQVIYVRKGRSQIMQYLKAGIGDVAILRADLFADDVVTANASDYKRLLPEVFDLPQIPTPPYLPRASCSFLALLPQRTIHGPPLKQEYWKCCMHAMQNIMCAGVSTFYPFQTGTTWYPSNSYSHMSTTI